MSLAERFVKEHATSTPENYASRVRWLAVIYVALNLISAAIMVAVAWRFQFFMTIAQRSNVETLTLAIIFVLALYYMISTFGGFIGAMRIILLNLPGLWTQDKGKIEWRKHNAIRTGGSPKAAYLDQAIVLKDKPGEVIIWQVSDDTAKLGEVELRGVEAKYYPIKDGMNNSLLEFLADKLEERLKRHNPGAGLQIVEWGEIDDDESAMYHSTVQAFQNLERQLEKGPIWPTLEITQEDVDYIQGEIRRLIPALRNEALLPDVEYAVEYNVPVLPEPLGFMKLTRNEARADPLVTMGCAGFVMLFLMAVLVLFIIFPPWLPSK
jgi:hypothetical protein